MATYIKMLVIFLLPSMLGMSCSHETEINVSGVEGKHIKSELDVWAKENKFSEVECEKYWSVDSVPLLCYQIQERKNKVPGYVLYLSRLQQKRFFRVGLISNYSKSELGELLNYSLNEWLAMKFGKENIESAK